MQLYRQLPRFVQHLVHQAGFDPENRRLTPDDVRTARTYIQEYWPKLERRQTKDDDSLVGLPHPYLVSAYEPDHEFDFNEMYYWDTYFMAQGFFGPEDGPRLEGLLDN